MPSAADFSAEINKIGEGLETFPEIFAVAVAAYFRLRDCPLQVIALDVDDDVGGTGSGCVLDEQIAVSIQRAKEGAVLRRAGPDGDHAPQWRIGGADEKRSGAVWVRIGDAANDSGCPGWHRVTANSYATN